MSPFFGTHVVEGAPPRKKKCHDLCLDGTVHQLPPDLGPYDIFSPRSFSHMKLVLLRVSGPAEIRNQHRSSVSSSTISSSCDGVDDAASEICQSGVISSIENSQAAADSLIPNGLSGKQESTDEQWGPLMDMAPPPSHEFERVRSLGKGAEGTCTLVRHRDSRQLYALKTAFSPRHLPQDRNGKPFEAKILASIHSDQHDNIIRMQFSAVNTYLTIPFVEYFFSYCELGDLCSFVDRHKWRRTFIPEPCIRKGFLQLASALEFLHRGFYSKKNYHGPGVVHRDLKPENILLRQALCASGPDAVPEFVLADFGHATFDFSTHDAHGTDYYKGPEIPRMSPKGDVWGLGAVVHTMIHFTGPIADERPDDDEDDRCLWVRDPKARRPVTRKPDPYSQTLVDTMLVSLRKYDDRPDSKLLLRMLEKGFGANAPEIRDWPLEDWAFDEELAYADEGRLSG